MALAFLTVNGVEAAAYLNFDYDNRVLVYNSGNDPPIRPSESGDHAARPADRKWIQRGRASLISCAAMSVQV